MSLLKGDNNNKSTKIFEKSYFNNSISNYSSINSFGNTISTSMSTFLDNLIKKKQTMQKEFDDYNNTILNLRKKRSKIMTNNHYLLSLSSTKFPLIKSRYKDIFDSQKQTKKETFNSSMVTTKKSSLKNNEIKKSKSEYQINFNKSKDFFRTSVEGKNKLVHFDDNLNKSNNNNFNNEKEIINSKVDLDEKKIIEEDKNKMDKNIMYRLKKISNKNLKDLPFHEEENLKEKEMNIEDNQQLQNDTNNKCNYVKISKHNNYLRRKKFKIDVIKGWEFKNGVNIIHFNEKAFIEDKEYQRNLISNQIDIIIDNTNFFKLNHINILSNYIKTDDLNQTHLISLNKLIEETSALYIEISHLIVKDFESFLYIKHKLSPCSPSEMIEGAKVTDEKVEFDVDIKLLNECTKFLSSSYEIYLVLSRQSKYIFPMKKFIKIRHFLNRARFNISNLVSISKKYIIELRYEKGIINQFNEQKELIEKNIKLKNKQYSNINRSLDELEDLKEKNQNVQSIGTDKIRRLNNLINPLIVNKNNNGKRYIGKHIDVDDKMFNKIVEYMEPDIKEKFEAFSVTQKKNSYKNKRKVYKFDF